MFVHIQCNNPPENPMQTRGETDERNFKVSEIGPKMVKIETIRTPPNTRLTKQIVHANASA